MGFSLTSEIQVLFEIALSRLHIRDSHWNPHKHHTTVLNPIQQGVRIELEVQLEQDVKSI